MNTFLEIDPRDKEDKYILMNEASKVKRRMTKQRKIILDLLKSTDTHPTANWIYDQVRKEIPNISLGTIYRNLNVLKEMGKIRELNYGAGYSRYDGNPDNHYHFKCRSCEKVIDVEIPVHIEINRTVEKVMNCVVKEHRIEFSGICQDCREEN